MSGAGGIVASTVQVIADGANLLALSVELQNELSTFQTEMDELKAVWHGDAVTALDETYSEFSVILSKFQQMLNAKGDAMKAAGNKLQTTEDENTAAASKARYNG